MADMFCSSCGVHVPAGAGYCPSCGTAVTGTAKASPALPVLPPPPAADGQAKQGVNGFAIASLVLSLVCLYGVGSILAVIFGNIARRQIREQGGEGDGMAKAGIIIGWVSLGIFAVIILIVLISSGNDSGSSY